MSLNSLQDKGLCVAHHLLLELFQPIVPTRAYVGFQVNLQIFFYTVGAKAIPEGRVQQSIYVRTRRITCIPQQLQCGNASFRSVIF